MQKIRVGVVFGFPLGDGGGLDRAVCAIMNSLTLLGLQVELVTFGQPDIRALKLLYGYDLEIEEVHGDSLYHLLVPVFRVPVSTVIALFHVITLSKKVRLLIFVGGRFHPTRFVPYRRKKAMCYMISPRWRPTAGILSEKGLSLPKKIFRILWDNTWPNPLGPLPDDFVVAHNSYAGGMIAKEFGLKFEQVLSLPSPDHNSVSPIKANQVVHFGRFHPEKRHDAALRIMSRVHSREAGATFVLMGLTNISAAAEAVLPRISDEADSLDGSVKIITNPPFETVMQTMAESKVILSMQLGPETYNMTLIEGMSQGCVPVIPKVKGGAWEDILDYGSYGFGFETEEEGAEIVVRLLTLPESEFEILSKRSRERAEFFGTERFTRRFGETIANFLEGPGGGPGIRE